MFNQNSFGERLKNHRKAKNYTQDDVASKIGVSAQAVSKWEKGECLPDVYNLKLLAKLYCASIDSLLDFDDDKTEKAVETIKVGNAAFEIIEKPATVLAGKILYAKDFRTIDSFHSAIGAVDDKSKKIVLDSVAECVTPICDIHLSVNFWLAKKSRAFGFVRETLMENQPESVDVYKMPASLYIKAYTDRASAELLSKEECDIWELFAYIRNFFMPAHGFKMADNGAQELEVFDTSEHKTGYAYMPIRT